MLVELDDQAAKSGTAVQVCVSSFVSRTALDVLRRPRDNFWPCLWQQKCVFYDHGNLFIIFHLLWHMVDQTSGQYFDFTFECMLLSQAKTKTLMY